MLDFCSLDKWTVHIMLRNRPLQILCGVNIPCVAHLMEFVFFITHSIAWGQPSLAIWAVQSVIHASGSKCNWIINNAIIIVVISNTCWDTYVRLLYIMNSKWIFTQMKSICMFNTLPSKHASISQFFERASDIEDIGFYLSITVSIYLWNFLRNHNLLKNVF